MCGIKWIVLRNENYTGAPVDALEDPVLTSFSRCLEAGLLAVWRRVPRRCLVTYSFDAAGIKGFRCPAGRRMYSLWCFQAIK